MTERALRRRKDLALAAKIDGVIGGGQRAKEGTPDDPRHTHIRHAA